MFIRASFQLQYVNIPYFRMEVIQQIDCDSTLKLQGRHGLAHLLTKRFPASNPEEMSKAIPPPTYLAPTLGEEDFEELSEEFFTDPFAVMKCKMRMRGYLDKHH